MDMEAGFLIGFREALEAALIIWVLVSLLYRTDRGFMAKWVWGGVVLAIVASVLTWQAFEVIVGEFSKKNEELFEGILYLIAAVLITTVILHVIGHATREVLENKAEKAIETREAFGIGLLAFVSVWREGVETVIFIGAGTESNDAITGLFIGIGTFSGPMVEPGSFYVTGLMPGRYNMIAQLDSGREVLLPDPVDIGITASYDVQMTIPGSFFNDTMLDSEGNVLANFTFELQDLGLSDEDVVLITTNETGYFEAGPLPPGDYYYRFDLDNDSFYEYNQTLWVWDDPSNFSIDFAIPVHQDVRIHVADSIFNSTTGQQELWDNSNRTVSFINSEDQHFVVNATSNETGDLLVELPEGMWVGTDTSDDVYILYDEFELLTDDLSLQWSYKKSVNVTGVVMMPEVYGLEHPEGENLPINYLPAAGIGVQFRSGSIIVTDVTNGSGMFEASLPEGIEFDVTAFSVTNQSAAGAHINVSDGMAALNLTFGLVSVGIGWLYQQC